jgi:hypothetical protein
MGPLSYPDYVKYRHMDAFLEKAAMTTSPPKTLNLSENWITISMHPAKTGSNVNDKRYRRKK